MAENEVPLDILNRRWLHSHEEDKGDEMVFRPATYPFPPSRGRMGFVLRPDGSAQVMGIAPTDAPQEQQGSWTIDAAKQLFVHVPALKQMQAMKIISSSPDRLVVKK